MIGRTYGPLLRYIALPVLLSSLAVAAGYLSPWLGLLAAFVLVVQLILIDWLVCVLAAWLNNDRCLLVWSVFGISAGVAIGFDLEPYRGRTAGLLCAVTVTSLLVMVGTRINKLLGTFECSDSLAIRLRRRLARLRLTAVCLTAYVGVYCLNSVCGGYWPRLDIGEYERPVYWEPRFGYYDPGSLRNDAVGYFFCPLIILDWELVHLPFGEGYPDSYERSLRMRVRDVHPVHRKWFEEYLQPAIEQLRMSVDRRSYLLCVDDRIRSPDHQRSPHAGIAGMSGYGALVEP